MDTRIVVEPTGGALGAEICDVTLSADLSDTIFDQIVAALAEHLVLRFPNHHLAEDDLVSFSARFGQLDMAPIRPSGLPASGLRREINVLSNIMANGGPVGGLGNSELVWHQDMTYKPLPPKASLLYAIEVPETGGETHFYNLCAAYETLPAALRVRIENLSCKHDATRNSAGQLRAGFDAAYSNSDRPGAVHPLVVRHPVTGKRSLYLGRRPNAWVVGLSDTESDQLLDDLWGHVESGDACYAHAWEVGDLVIWDNRFTLHRRGTLDPQQRRLMYRAQVRDTEPPMAA